MNKVICNRLDLIHRNEIEKMDADHIVLKSGKNFTTLPLHSGAVYSNDSQNSNPGSSINETVTAQIKYTDSLTIIKIALQYYVLRLYTDSGSFIVGSIDYPAELTHSTDKMFVNLTFRASTPL